VPGPAQTGPTTFSLKPPSDYILKVAALAGELDRFIEGFQTLELHPVRILNELLDDPDLTPNERFNVEQVWTVIRDNVPAKLRAEFKRTKIP
jgi:hypothetical protein